MPPDPFERGWHSVDDQDRPVVSEEEILRQDKARRSRGVIRAALRLGSLLVVLGGFATLLVYAYNWGTGEVPADQVPVVQAAATPEKEAPAERGGLEVPYQDSLLLNPSEQGQEVERIVPPPEEPVALPKPTAAAESAPEPQAPGAAAESQAEGGDAIGKLIQMAELNGVGTDANKPAVPEAKPAPPPAPPAAAGSAPKATQLAQVGQVSGFKVQLGSLKDEAGARAEWTRLQKLHSDLLGSLTLDVERVDLPEKGVYYRIQGGPLPSRETATDLCAQLKRRDQPCIVVAP